MHRPIRKSVLLLMVASLGEFAAMHAQAVPEARTFLEGTLSGVVQDTDGVPQMGALVVAMLPSTRVVASALTDSRGRYRFALNPGSYRIRATAALLSPAIREGLRIASGARAVANLTLTTIVAPGGWLPASRRSSTDPGDEWMWTLRSSANRSILRLNPEDGSDQKPSVLAVGVSSSGQESHRGSVNGHITLKDSDGGFARGGNHSILVLTRTDEDGSGAILRADLSGTRSPYPVAPSAEISVGMQRHMPLNGLSRAVLTYSSHPELTSATGVTGMRGATLRSVQRLELGDVIRVDVGSVLRDSNFGRNTVVLEPFLRIVAQPGSGVWLAYSMTRSRGTKSLEDLDHVQAAIPVAVLRNGHLELQGGKHQALTMSGKLPGGGVVEAALYQDELYNPLISGAGVFAQDELQGYELVTDPTTRTFRVATRNYSSAGVRVGLQQPVTNSLNAGLTFATGNALKAARHTPDDLRSTLGRLATTPVYAAAVTLDGKVLSTGTSIHAGYRWQPRYALTAVDAFHNDDEGAFLSCSMRQSLSRLRFLPNGLEAVLDMQNLLSQGYVPFLSRDGQRLYLAQTTRTLQAGVSFSF